MFLVSKPTEKQIRQFIASQQDLPFTYSEVGATQSELPTGYTHDHNRVQLGKGRAVFQRAVSSIRNWQQFDLGWVQIVPKGVPIRVGATVAVQAKSFGIWSLSAARIVYVVNEEDGVSRFGFAYGTLPDHVEKGEERFLVEWDHADDSVWYDIVAFSRPRHPLVRLSFPLARMLQKRFARDSMAAMKNRDE
jgi:uncharacterized protein (UPF0548 family)